MTSRPPSRDHFTEEETPTATPSEFGSDTHPDLQKAPQTDDDPEALTRLETSHSSISPPKSLGKETAFVATVCMAQFMTQAGLAVAIAPGHIIGASFGTQDPGELSWFPAAYSLTVGTFILMSGRLGDVYGHRFMFILGFLWFGIWSLLAGFSVWSNRIFYDCCRALQGIGPAMLFPNAVAILGQTYKPGRRKEMVFSLFGAAAPGGFVVGGVFSSLFAQRVWWPWGYWVMGMGCFVLAGLGLLVIPHIPRQKFNDRLSPIVRLDVLGAATGICGLILINLAWNQAPLVGWSTPYTYVLLIIGFAFLTAFAFIERSAECPLLPRSAFTGDLGWVLGCIAAGWSSFGIMIYYFFQFMIVVKGDSGLLATAKFSGAAISGAMASMVTGFLLGRLPPSVIMFCAMGAFATGLCLFATVPVSQTYWAQAFVMSLITPWGM
ncbi:uncharacterized protein CDV56_108070 [Aspergillus thermomutatus]|uniref:Major facilitator superfamily (MFS) profile domain-containing protein n=1 Tax=Aspergillus thermomutatus TaxID=41047 RepID=A0A397HY61_ASPTH|nr:uncharacterized protein CDV56_108070 [Aspergillus thermomutatus]RHZ65510.1 hypothetical protein CDV56_108070 [Aspergillus thermomutatus]